MDSKGAIMLTVTPDGECPVRVVLMPDEALALKHQIDYAIKDWLADLAQPTKPEECRR